jgi:hypothetical protein
MAEVLGYAVLAVIWLFITVIAINPLIGFVQEKVEDYQRNRLCDRLSRDVRYREQMKQFNRMRKWGGR